MISMPFFSQYFWMITKSILKKRAGCTTFISHNLYSFYIFVVLYHKNILLIAIYIGIKISRKIIETMIAPCNPQAGIATAITAINWQIPIKMTKQNISSPRSILLNISLLFLKAHKRTILYGALS